MRYHNIIHCDFANNLEGVGVTLFVSGCNHKCPGCQNPQTWSPKSGIHFGEKAKNEIFSALENPDIKAFTVSGGDPLYPDNRETILGLLKEVKEKFPDKSVWLYTGYLYNEIKDLEILKYVDVLVDGPFMEKMRNNQCKIKGSANQKVIKLVDGQFAGLYEEP